MPPKAKAHTDLRSAAASGDRLAALRELRDLLARSISGVEVPARDVAALSRQLTLVLAEIAELAPPAQVKGNPLDELNRRRVARGADPARKVAAGRG